MDWDVQRATTHLESMAKRHEITIVWTDSPPSALRSHWTVYLRRPFNAVEYLSGLHEMGHLMSPRALRFEGKWLTEYDNIVLMEAAAWAWAVRFCDPDLLEEIPPKTWKIVGAYLATYLVEIPYLKLDTGA